MFVQFDDLIVVFILVRQVHCNQINSELIGKQRIDFLKTKIINLIFTPTSNFFKTLEDAHLILDQVQQHVRVVKVVKGSSNQTAKLERTEANFTALFGIAERKRKTFQY